MKNSTTQKFDTQTGQAGRMTGRPRKARMARVATLIVVTGILSACSNMLTLNPNREPVITISPSSFTVYPGDSVTFDSGDTTDPDGQQLEVQWEVVSAPTGSTYFLDDITSFSPTFVSYFRNVPGSTASDRYVVGPEDYSVPNYLGDYTLRKTVTDEYGVERSSEVTVTVANAAPGADAGGNSIGVAGTTAGATNVEESVTLSGTGGDNEESSRRNTWQYRWIVTDQPSGSADPNLTVGNTWTDPSDPAAAGTALTTFTPQIGGSDVKAGEGVYTLRLEVRDEYGATSSDSVVVATEDNTAPALSMPDVTNVTVETGGTRAGDGTSGSPFSNSAHGTTGDNYAFQIEYTSSEITNLEDDTMTVVWRVEDIRGAFDEIRLGINSGIDRYYGIGDTLITQTGVVDQFDLRINPAQDIASNPSFRTNGSGTPGGSAAPDGTWDVAIRLVADDGWLTAELVDQPVIYIDLYTLP